MSQSITGILRRLLLVDDDGDGQILDGVDMRTAILGQILLHKRGEGVVQFAARLGGDGVEHKRALARARHAREHRDLVLGNLKRDVLQVILARSAYDDFVVFHNFQCLAQISHSVYCKQPFPAGYDFNDPMMVIDASLLFVCNNEASPTGMNFG